MKKILAVSVVSVCVGAAAHAATVRDNCGCGLGSLALGDQEATLVIQTFATTLNGLCGNQTFGITSGTLGCEPWSVFAAERQLEEYVNDNMDHLAMDMAMGTGDSLDALADLMMVSNDDRPAFYGTLQSHFDRIFTTEEVTANEVLKNISDITQS